MSYLETLVTRFYEKHDASKLGDVSHVTGIISWTKNNGMDALEAKLKGKYKETLKTLEKPGDPPLDSDWKNVHKALEKFYSKHEPNKPDEQILEIYKWAIQKGVFALNEKLSRKYGEGLPKKALESWKSRWAPVVEESKSATYGELLTAFFQIHDPMKPKSDIEFLASYATRHGIEPVNDQLRLNFGVGLEDVESRIANVPGPSSLKTALASVKISQDPNSTAARKEQLASQLKEFYAKQDPSKLLPANKDAFDKIVDYGITKGLRKLNTALREKYKEDLDSARRDTIRQSVREFLNQNDPTAAQAETEADVEFAIENGMGALDEKLKNEYGASLTTGSNW